MAEVNAPSSRIQAWGRKAWRYLLSKSSRACSHWFHYNHVRVCFWQVPSIRPWWAAETAEERSPRRLLHAAANRFPNLEAIGMG